VSVRLAVFSDIHGNAVALDAMLEDLARHPADAMVCLGDAVQGGPEPARTVERLRALACPVVMGNADAWLLSGVETSGNPPPPERQRVLDAVREWSLSKLGAEDRAFIAGFAPTVTVPLGDGPSLLGFHGSPASFDEILLPDTPSEIFERALGPHTRHRLAGGHVHLPYVRRLGDSFHFNPGSVGMAYEQGQTTRVDAWAEYAVLTVEGDRHGLEFRRVPYPVETLARAYRESGRPFAKESLAQYGVSSA
jgi:predicted phosphodiesterase